MKKKQHFVISWGIYPFDVMISIGTTTEEVIKAITKLGCELSDNEKKLLEVTGRGRTVMLENGQTVIRLKSYSQSVLAHEIFHAVCFLFDRIGITFSSDSDEAFAYAIEYLTREINYKINH
ncbi:MAG: hypothetical protein WC788_03780 [Candidatus Paceibacterota bacterium]|jgi:hypothetical protein